MVTFPIGSGENVNVVLESLLKVLSNQYRCQRDRKHGFHISKMADVFVVRNNYRAIGHY